MSIAAPSPGLMLRTRPAAAATVYSRWCSVAGWRLRIALSRLGVDHRFVDTGIHPEQATLLDGLRGADALRHPIVCLDGEWMVDPTIDEIAQTARRHGLEHVPERRGPARPFRHRTVSEAAAQKTGMPPVTATVDPV